MHNDFSGSITSLLFSSCKFYLHVISMCEPAITFFAKVIRMENIDFRVLQKILLSKSMFSIYQNLYKVRPLFYWSILNLLNFFLPFSANQVFLVFSLDFLHMSSHLVEAFSQSEAGVTGRCCP